MFSVRSRSAAQAFALVAAPLLCGAAYWRAFAPARHPGVYVADRQQHVHPVDAGFDDPGDAGAPTIDSRLFPTIDVPRVGAAPESFYLYAPEAMSPPLDPASLAAWFVAYDPRGDREFHTAPEAMPLEVADVGDGLYRLLSPRLKPGWISDRLAQLTSLANADTRFVRPGIVLVGRTAGTHQRRRFFVPIAIQ
jgi:hypothetical protein